MNQEEDINIDAVLAYWPEEDAHRYGWEYNSDLPDEALKSMTYPQTNQYSYRAPPIQKEIEATSDYVKVGPAGNAHYKQQNKKSMQAFCPYDFRTSVDVPLEWELVSSLDQTILSQANFKDQPIASDIKFVGKSNLFDKKLIGIRSTVRTPLPQTQIPAEVPLMEDPNIIEIASTPTEKSLRVFGTVKTIAAITVCSRSIYPFDLVFEKKCKDVYILTRTADSGAVLETNLETLNTTAQVQRDRMTLEFKDNTIESTNVNADFIARGVENQPEVVLGEEFERAYLYRRYEVGDIEFIIRSEVDAIRDPPVQGKRPTICLCRVFNDVPTGLRQSNWQADLEKQRGATLSMEANANASKIGRWVSIAHLMAVDQCFIGFAIRKTPSSRKNHTLLGVEKFTPLNLARVIALKQSNMFGILTTVFSKLTNYGDGKFAFVRESKKKIFNIYNTSVADAPKPATAEE